MTTQFSICRLWLLAAALAAFDPTPAVAQPTTATKPATMTLDELVAGMEQTAARWASLSSWMVHYHHTRKMLTPLPGFGEDYPSNEMINARKGKWMYSWESQRLDLKLNPSAGPDDKSQYWIAWKGDVCVERDDDQLSILPEPSSRAYQTFFFTGWLGLDLQGDMEVRSGYLRKLFKGARPSEREARVMLPGAIVRSKGEYKVRPQLEVVDGVPCHVVERAGYDVLWVDPSIGYLFRRRLYYDSPGRLAADLQHEEFREYAPGIWLPQRSKSQAYASERLNLPEYKGKPNALLQHTLVAARFNDLPDSYFNVPIPEQATVHDYIRGYTYIKHPPGSDPLQHALERSLASSPDLSRPRHWSWQKIAMVAALGIEAILLGLLVQLINKARTNPGYGGSAKQGTDAPRSPGAG